jgi:hypothetical protein
MYLPVPKSKNDTLVKVATEAVESIWITGEWLATVNKKPLNDVTDKELPSKVPAGYATDKSRYEYLRRCERFYKAYTDEQTENLKELIVKHSNPLGMSLLFVLATCTNLARRQRLERECVENRWSRARLQAELIDTEGRKRQGGRRNSIEAGTAMVRLEQGARSLEGLLTDLAGTELPPAIAKTAKGLTDQLGTLRGQIRRAQGR